MSLQDACHVFSEGGVPKIMFIDYLHFQKLLDIKDWVHYPIFA